MPLDDDSKYVTDLPDAPLKRVPPRDLSDPLDTIAHYESGDRNVPNYRFDPGHTAQGHYQITNTNWRAYGPKAGVNTSQFPSAMKAPKEVQRGVANTMFQAHGFNDWAPFNPALRSALKRGEGGGTAAQQPSDDDSKYITDAPADDDSKYVSPAPTSAPANPRQPAQPRKVTSLAQVKQEDEAHIQATDKLAHNISWHFGDSVLNRFNELPEEQQVKIAQLATKYAADDETKKRNGQPIVESYDWKKRNQQQVGVQGDSVTDRGEMMMRQQGLTNEDLALRRDEATSRTNPLLKSTGVMRWLKETGAHGTAGLLSAAAGATRASSGVSPVGQAAAHATGWLQEKSSQLHGVTAQAEEHAPMGGAAKVASGMGAGLIEFLPLLALGHPEGIVPAVASGAASFGGYTGLQAYGEGATPGQALKEGAKAAPFGALMGVPGSVFGNAVDSGFKNAMVGTAVKGAGYYGIGRAEGMTPEEAGENALVLSAFAGPELAGEALNAVLGRAVRRPGVSPIDPSRPMEPAVKSAIDSAFEVAGVSPEIAEKALKTPVIDTRQQAMSELINSGVTNLTTENITAKQQELETANITPLNPPLGTAPTGTTPADITRIDTARQEAAAQVERRATPRTEQVGFMTRDMKQRLDQLGYTTEQQDAMPRKEKVRLIVEANRRGTGRVDDAEWEAMSPEMKAAVKLLRPTESVKPEPKSPAVREGAKPSAPASEDVLRNSQNATGSGIHQVAQILLENPKWKEHVLKELGAGAKPLDNYGSVAEFQAANGDVIKIRHSYAQAEPATLGTQRDGLIIEREKASTPAAEQPSSSKAGSSDIEKPSPQAEAKPTAVMLGPDRYVRSGNDWLYNGKQKVTNLETIAALDAKLESQRGSFSNKPKDKMKLAPPGVKTGATADRTAAEKEISRNVEDMRDDELNAQLKQLSKMPLDRLDKYYRSTELRNEIAQRKETAREEARVAKLESTPIDPATMKQAVADVNDRQNYGKRTEKPAQNGYRLSWSNSSADWGVNYVPVPKGKEISLDANEIFVPGSRKQAEAIAHKLPALPLGRLAAERNPLFKAGSTPEERKAFYGDLSATRQRSQIVEEPEADSRYITDLGDIDTQAQLPQSAHDQARIAGEADDFVRESQLEAAMGGRRPHRIGETPPREYTQAEEYERTLNALRADKLTTEEAHDWIAKNRPDLAGTAMDEVGAQDLGDVDATTPAKPASPNKYRIDVHPSAVGLWFAELKVPGKRKGQVHTLKSHTFSTKAAAEKFAAEWPNRIVERDGKMFEIAEGTLAIHEAPEGFYVTEAKPNGRQLAGPYADFHEAAAAHDRLSKAREDANYITDLGDTNMMRVREGEDANARIIAAGFDPKLIPTIAKNMYAKETGQIVPKELLQNAVDAIRPVMEANPDHKGKISLDVQTGDLKDGSRDKGPRSFTITDNGVGMLPDVIDNQFTDLGGTLKQSLESSGGYGIAKGAMFYNADRIEVFTTAYDPATKQYVASELHGSGEDWLDPKKGLRATSRNLGPTGKTGTTVKIVLKDEAQMSPYNTRNLIDNFLKHHKLPYEFDIKIDGEQVKPDLKGAHPRLLGTRTVLGAELRFYASDTLPRAETSYISTRLLNHGLPQANSSIRIQGATVPDSITVDVRNTVKPSEDNYPWLPSREGLRGPAEDAVVEFINKGLVEDAVNAKRALYIRTMREAPKVPGTKYGVVDTSGNVPRGELEYMAKHPAIGKLVQHLNDMLAGAAQASAKYLPRSTKADMLNYEFGGLGLGRDYYGINIKGKYVESPHEKVILINAPAIVEAASELGKAGKPIGLEVYHPEEWGPVNLNNPKFRKEIKSQLDHFLEWNGRDYPDQLSDYDLTLKPAPEGQKPEEWFGNYPSVFLTPKESPDLLPDRVDWAARRMLATATHEVTHNLKGGHGEDYSSLQGGLTDNLGAVYGRLDPQLKGITDLLTENNYAFYNYLKETSASIQKFSAEGEDIFTNIRDSHGAKDVKPGGLERLSRQGEEVDAEGRRPVRTGEPASPERVAPGAEPRRSEPVIGIVASDGTVRGKADPGRNLDHGRVFPEVWSTSDHWHYEPSTETVYWTAGNASPEAKHAAENFLDRKGLDVKRHSDYMTYLKDTKDLSDRLEGMTEDELVANIFEMEGGKPAPSTFDTLQRSMEGKPAAEHPSATQPRTPETGQFAASDDYGAISTELYNAGKRMQTDYARIADHPARRDLSTASDMSVRNYFRQLYNFVNTHEPSKLPLVRQAEDAQFAGDHVKATIFAERALTNTHDFANELNNAVLATRMLGQGVSLKASTDWRGVLRTVRERGARAERGFSLSSDVETKAKDAADRTKLSNTKLNMGFDPTGNKPVEPMKVGPEGVKTGAVADLESARREKERRLPKHLERTEREPGADLTYVELPNKLTKARVEQRIADQGLAATEEWYKKQDAEHPEAGAELTDAFRQLSDHYLSKLATADNPADIARLTAKAKELAQLEAPRSTGLGQAVQAYAMLDKYSGPEVLLEAQRLVEREGKELPPEVVKDIATTGQEFKAADEQLTEVRKELAKEEKGLGPGKGAGRGPGKGADTGTAKRLEQLRDQQTKLIERRQQAKIRQERTLAKLERPSTKLDYYLRFNNIVRGFMVSAIPTAVRNYETQGVRFGVERLVDLFAHGMRRADAKDPHITAGNIHRDMLRLFQSESRSKAVAIAGEYPKELRRLFATYGGGQVETAQAAKTFGGRVEKAFGSVENFVQHINWLNQLQEFHIRGAEFLSHLDMLVEREHGMPLEQFLRQRGADRISKEAIKDSVDHALEVTFADLPAQDTALGKHMNNLIKIGNLVPPTVSPIPFARWFYNAWKFNYQFSPLGLADLARTPRQLREARRALQRVELRPPAKTETLAARRTIELEKARANVTRLEENAKIERYRTVAKAAIGTTFLLGAYAARSSPLAGEKWYEMYIPGTDTLIDMRPFAPFSTYLFLAEGARRMIHKERPYSKNEFFAGLGASTAQTGGMEVLYDKYRRGDFASLTRALQTEGSDLGTAILTPVRQLRDLIGEFDKSQSTTYDTSTQPFAGPLKTSIPYGERLGTPLPKAYKPLSDEPIHGTHPATKFLGPRIITPKNFVEKEADRLRFDFNEVRPATGVPEVDQLEEQWMGEYVGKQATKLGNNPNYARMPDSAKAELYLKPLFAAGRTVARARLATEHPNLYMKLIERSKSARQRAMETDFGVKPLANPY